MEIANGKVTLHAGDCLEVLAALAENSIDAVVTDPPYELGFMGKSWDASGVAFCPGTWHKVLRVLKPGGHLVAFGAPKNYHRLACAIEDAGFEIRDSLMWVFGTGFPKSHDISKAIDKSGGVCVSEFKLSLRRHVERSGKTRAEIDALCGFTMRFDTPHEADPSGWGCSLPSPKKWLKICDVLGCDVLEYQELVDRVWRGRSAGLSSKNNAMSGANYQRSDKGRPVFDEARKWEGWGTALKPAYEPIVLARKPLSEGTVAANVLRWGTGALNIDACRIATDDVVSNHSRGSASSVSKGIYGDSKAQETHQTDGQALGRWPANLCHDGSQGVLELFPQNSGANGGKGKFRQHAWLGEETEQDIERDKGSAARFFYSAKASKQDRAGSKHPTVKPVSLMQWLVRMITPPGGTVLDPFAGTGTTGRAAVNEGFQSVLIEREEEYRADIVRRFDV